MFLIFYINNFFDEFQDFEKQFIFFRNYFFKVKWVKFKLLFKELKLFMKQLRAPSVTHKVKEYLHVLNERIKKIIKWFISRNSLILKTFLNTMNIIQKWIKIFLEVIKSLFRLINKIKRRWKNSKQFFFKILQIKYAIEIVMHYINFILIIHFYIDAFKYKTELAITQFRMKKSKISFIEILILYDFFIFSFTQKLYFTYKKNYAQ